MTRKKKALVFDQVLLKKLRAKVCDRLEPLDVETQGELIKALDAANHEIMMWRGLWCDQPEDRLWHDKDRTWWKRRFLESGEPVLERPYSPVGAEPPAVFKTLFDAVRAFVKRMNLSPTDRRTNVYWNLAKAMTDLGQDIKDA